MPPHPLGLIVVAAIDPLLRLPDFNMPERVFRLIFHLREIPHESFFIQTYNPDDSFLRLVAEHDIDAFADAEGATRSALGYPPFAQFIKLTLRGRNSEKTYREAVLVHQKLQQLEIAKENIRVLGPVPGFIPRERGRYIWQILLQLPSDFPIARRNAILANITPAWEIDVDPETIL